MGATHVKMSWPDRALVCRLAVRMAAVYVAGVVMLAVAKVTLPVLQAMP